MGVAMSFLLSAVFHELLIAVPLHSIKGYAFFGMLGQASHHSPAVSSVVVLHLPDFGRSCHLASARGKKHSMLCLTLCQLGCKP